MKRIFTILASQFIFLLLLFILIRLLFFFAYKDLFKNISVDQIIVSFVYGIRFDLSVICLFYGTLNIFLFFPYPVFQHRYFIKLIAFIGYCVLIPILFIQLCDIAYYGEIGRRLTFEIFTLFGEVNAMLQIVFQNKLFPFIVGLFVMGLVSVAWWKMWQMLLSLSNDTIKVHWSFQSILFFFMLIVFVVGARGGFQTKPIIESFAFRGPILILGHFTLNAPFTVTRQFTQKIISPYHWIPYEIAKKKTQILLNSNNEENFLSDEFIFLRNKKLPAEHSPNLKNLILIILESWSAKDIDALGGKPKNVTPYFNELSKKGIFFTRFFSNGTRSIEGIGASLLSIPSFEDFALIMSSFEQNSMITLPQILEKYDYETLFIHGNYRGSFGFHEFAKRIGFKKVLAQQDFENYKEKSDGTWGIWDEHQFDQLYKEVENFKKPFFATIFTSSSHEPFIVPDPSFEYFKEKTPNYEWLNTVRYSDWSLGQFFKKAEKTKWFEDTLFIITSDHTIGGQSHQRMDSGRIPFILYAPKQLTAKQEHTPASQIDIVPTIIDYLKLPDSHTSMGKSLLNKEKQGFSLFSSSTNLWLMNGYAYEFSYNKLLGIYHYEEDWHFKNPLSKKENPIHEINIEYYLSWMQSAHDAVVSNKIAPAFGE